MIGPWMAGYLAMIYTRVGELDLALPLLQHLLAVPARWMAELQHHAE